MKHGYSFLFAVAAAVFCGCGKPSIRALDSASVVVAFGDSLTAGTGAEESESYPAVLAEMLGATVKNEGLPGEVSGDGVARLPRVLRKHRPDLVILCHGGNDFLQRADDAAVEANLQKMVDAVRESGADAILLGVPRPGLFLKASPAYVSVARRNGIPYDVKTLPEILSAPSLKSDTIHPNAQGYRKLAGRVAKLIKRSEK